MTSKPTIMCSFNITFRNKKKCFPVNNQCSDASYQFHRWWYPIKGPAEIYIALIYTCSPQPDDTEQWESRNGCSEWNRVKWHWASPTKRPLSLSLNERRRVGPGLTAPSDPPHLHCPAFILSLNASDGITAHIDRLSVLPRPQRPRVATEWPGCQKKRKTKFGSISVTSPRLLGYGGRINSFSLTCLSPCELVGIASGASKCYSDSVWGMTSLSLFHTHTLTRFPEIHSLSLANHLTFIDMLLGKSSVTPSQDIKIMWMFNKYNKK